MKKIILILIMLIVFSNFVISGSCWYVLGFNNQTNPSISWNNSSPESLTINGNTWDRVVFSNSILTAQGFGSYNRLCDDGVSSQTLNYVTLKIENDKLFGEGMNLDGFNYEKLFTNTTGNGPAESLGQFYCQSDRGFNVTPSGDLLAGSTATNVRIGQGNLNKIEFSVLNEFGPEISKQRQYIGGYKANINVMREPRAGEYGRRPRSLYNESFFFAPPPSVFIMPLGDNILGFYEKEGYYEKEVFYTIKAQTYLDLTIKNINIECNLGADCFISPEEQEQFTMGYNNDVLIISAIIRIPKNDIPKTITYNLSLDYDITNLAALGSNYKDISVESTISKIDVGYLDQQDFQIKILGSTDDASCEGYGGLVGSTGEIVAPRVNVQTNFSNGFNEQMCSPENEDWVYCSQRELLVTLANKVSQIFDLYIIAQEENDDLLRAEIYSEINEKKSFEIYTRNLNLDKINESLQLEQELFQTDPLTSLEGDTPINNIIRARSLFENANFFRNTGLMNFEIDSEFDVGKYQIDIQIGGEGINIIDLDIPASETQVEFSTNYLFNNNNELINPEKINLKINFRKIGGEPLLDWFFYEFGVESLDESINQTSNNFYDTQFEKRGQVLNFEQDIVSFNVENIKAYPSFAIPIFIKVQNDENLLNNFQISDIDPIDNIRGTEFENSIFSYWTGFASSMGDGCTELLKGEDSLVYRMEDRITEFSSDQGIFEIELYYEKENELQIGKEYLQTVIYAPILSSLGNTLTFDINPQNQNVYNKNGVCNNNNNCKIQLTNSNYVVNWNTSLQDIINGIKNETICVTANQDGTTNRINWTLFWNENKIIGELTPAKREIINNDAESNICEGLPERTP